MVEIPPAYARRDKGYMKTQTDFRDTPIGEAFEQTKHDLRLIQADVESKQFDSALRGMDFQIKAMQELRDNMGKTFTAYNKAGKI